MPLTFLGMALVAHSSTDVPIARVFAAEGAGKGHTAARQRVPRPAEESVKSEESDHAGT